MEVPAETSHRTPLALPGDAALRAIAEGVEAETGDRFFSSLARNLALALEVAYAFVTRLSDDGTHFKILALWERDHFGSDAELPLRGTPCESVLHGEVAHYPDELRARFPADRLLAKWGAHIAVCLYSTRRAEFSVISRFSTISRCRMVSAASP